MKVQTNHLNGLKRVWINTLWERGAAPFDKFYENIIMHKTVQLGHQKAYYKHLA